MGGTWTAGTKEIIPGIYTNVVDAATAAITGGQRGVVAIPIFEHAGTAEDGKFYVISDINEAKPLFGSANVGAIELALSGGSKNVLAYAVPAKEPEGDYDYDAILSEFTTQQFNVFVYPAEQAATEEDKTKAWVVSCRNEEGKQFTYVAGGTAEDDKTPERGNARSIRLKDKYVVNLINGGIAGGEELHSGKYAAYIAGLIAATPINKSITFMQLPLSDVNKRLKRVEQETALKAGSLVLVNDGAKVKVLQGVTTDSDEAKRGKIRSACARQAIITDISRTVEDNYIGKIDNNPDGQAALISAIKAYLEVLEDENVLMEPVVELDPKYESVGDSVYLLVSYVDVDSMEHVYLTISA